MSRSLKLIKLLDSVAPKALTSLLVSGYASLRRGALTRIYHQDECWIQADASGSKATNEIRWEDGIEELFTWTEEIFSYKYSPQHGDVIFDVGAGIGIEAVYYSQKVGMDGKVFALEAHPKTFSCLEKNITLNKSDNVFALQVAAASETGTLFIDSGENYLANSTGSNSEGEEVPAMPLDKICQEHQLTSIDFLKMNIEGAELDALRGMQNCLEICSNLAISCHDFLADRGGDDSTRTKTEVCRLLKERGFELHFRENDSRDWIRDFVYATKSA